MLFSSFSFTNSIFLAWGKITIINEEQRHGPDQNRLFLKNSELFDLFSSNAKEFLENYALFTRVYFFRGPIVQVTFAKWKMSKYTNGSTSIKIHHILAKLPRHEFGPHDFSGPHGRFRTTLLVRTMPLFFIYKKCHEKFLLGLKILSSWRAAPTIFKITIISRLFSKMPL